MLKEKSNLLRRNLFVKSNLLEKHFLYGVKECHKRKEHNYFWYI